MDFFAGSGTTFHAAISARHDDRQRRRVLLIEHGPHFDSVLLPRLKRVSAAWVWKNGKPLAINGPGLFMRVQRLEQYEDTLENLATATGENQPLFSGPEALAYELDAEARHLLLAADHFTTPFGLTLKRIVGADVIAGPVDLVESLIYLLGLRVNQLFRQQGSVIITGVLNRTSETAAIFWRDNLLHDAGWLQTQMADYPADRYYTNDPARLSFPGIDKFSAIETVFVEGMNGNG
jgi:adenine-specific DNA-methyltransferase